MTFEDFTKDFLEAYEELIKKRDSADYEPNPTQWGYLMDIIEFFFKTAEVCGNAEIEPVQLIPKEIVGCVTAKFVLFHIYDDAVKRFCSVLQHASAVSIDSTTDGYAVISVTVPDVFRKKSK